MSLTPIDVQQKTFGTALRGYDLDEVDDFLDEIVTSLKDYEQRLRDAQERIATLESEMSDRGDAEGAISRALVAAQRSADAIVDEARVEADRILADARSQADEVIVQRERELENAQGEVDRLRSTVDDLRRKVRGLADELDESIGGMEAAIDDAEQALSSTDTTEADDELDEPVDDRLRSPLERRMDALAFDDHHDDGSELDPFGGEAVEETEVEIAATAESSESTYDPTLESTYERSARPWEDA